MSEPETNAEVNTECVYQRGGDYRRTCCELFNCCDCGVTVESRDNGGGCGCRYCFSCNACEYCLNKENQDGYN